MTDGSTPTEATDCCEALGLGLDENRPRRKPLRLRPRPDPATRPKSFAITQPIAKLKPTSILLHVREFKLKLDPFAEANLPRAKQQVGVCCLPSRQRDLAMSIGSTGMSSDSVQSTTVLGSSRTTLLSTGRRSRAHGSARGALNLGRRPPSKDKDQTTNNPLLKSCVHYHEFKDGWGVILDT